METWKIVNSKLVRVFEFKDFVESMSFVNNVANLAEEHEHHPEIKINYNKVELSLNTHSAGDKITEKDLLLAKEIDKL